jgi:hypothetical protein
VTKLHFHNEQNDTVFRVSLDGGDAITISNPDEEDFWLYMDTLSLGVKLIEVAITVWRLSKCIKG